MEKEKSYKHKKGNIQASESTSPINADYGMNVSGGIITQNAPCVNSLCENKPSEGEWIAKHHMSRSPRGRYTSYFTFTCNVCGKLNGRRKTPFCPHCGAEMITKPKGE